MIRLFEQHLRRCQKLTDWLIRKYILTCLRRENEHVKVIFKFKPGETKMANQDHSGEFNLFQDKKYKTIFRLQTG